KEGHKSGLKKGRKAGIEEGQLKTSRDDVIEILAARFGRVPASLTKTIKTVDNISRLKALLREAATTQSVTQFQAAMNTRGRKNGKTEGPK
ncbi:MAG TPA: hypothetical protein VI756_10020, partial [Blastocatellia bacterium]